MGLEHLIKFIHCFGLLKQYIKSALFMNFSKYDITY